MLPVEQHTAKHTPTFVKYVVGMSAKTATFDAHNATSPTTLIVKDSVPFVILHSALSAFSVIAAVSIIAHPVILQRTPINTQYTKDFAV